GNISVPVVVGNLLLADHYEISETKVQVFFHFETLLDDFVQFFTGQTDTLKPLLELNLRRKISCELIARVTDFFLRGHDRGKFFGLLKDKALVYQEAQGAIQVRGRWIVEHSARLQRQLPEKIGVGDQICF